MQCRAMNQIHFISVIRIQLDQADPLIYSSIRWESSFDRSEKSRMDLSS